MKTKLITVDDEMLNAKGIEQLIQRQIDEVEMVGTFFDSLEALEFLKHNKVDIVITDIRMPELNGLELIREIREIDKNIEIIICTGYASFEYAKEAMKYGVKHFLQKPISIPELIQSISSSITDYHENLNRKRLLIKDDIEKAILGGKKFDSNDIQFNLLLFQKEEYKRINSSLRIWLKNEDIPHTISLLEKGLLVIFYEQLTPQFEENLISLGKVLVFYKEGINLQNVRETFNKGIELLEIYSNIEADSVVILNDEFIKNYTDNRNFRLITKKLNMIIATEYHNTELSLKWISNHILFQNSNYLGKIYLKETGKKFSQKLLEVRMKKATELLMKGCSILEVAEKIGYGNNPDYFGQAFKKYYSITPGRFVQQNTEK